MTFPVQPQYPNGYPSAISTVYFINRVGNTCCFNRVKGMYIYLVAANGTIIANRTLTYNGTVSTFTFNDYQRTAVYPNASISGGSSNSTGYLSSSFESNVTNLNNLVRYVRVASNPAPNACFSFRELMVSSMFLLS